jgi:two-component system, OmpR family, sensor histidine kinase CiaH
MAHSSRKRLLRTTAIYWMLLCYVIAALVWWFISLNQQNAAMRTFQENHIRLNVDSIQNAAEFNREMEKARKEYRVNKSKYIGEGSTFFLLIVLSAIYVFRAVRRQFMVQAQQENFMMAVTHELKTPLSVTRLNLETLQKYNLDPEKQKKLIRITLDETERLNFLTNNILVSAQMEAQGYESPKEELDFSDLLKDRLQELRNFFPDRELREKIDPEIAIRGDAVLLQMLINNLVENAIKYSPKDATITATLKKQGSKIELIVTDEGPGIPDPEKKKIFDKFYRIGDEATRKKQGTGLGLYLCKRIAKDHNGDIMVTNNEAGGSNFIVTFHT